MTARHPAVASLFMHLIDDAAVFPPGTTTTAVIESVRGLGRPLEAAATR